jgi:hypothetical protein
MQTAASSPLSPYYQNPQYSLPKLLSAAPGLHPYCSMRLPVLVIQNKLAKSITKPGLFERIWDLADVDKVYFLI